jgi:hypothetical protein
VSTKPIWSAICAILILFMASGSTTSASPAPGGAADLNALEATVVASVVSYQGYLTDAGGVPISGSRDLVFQLWDDAGAGSQVGADIVHNNVPVTDGLFTVHLAVPADSFDGQALWLRISADGQWLAPRQALRPVPYALGLRPGAVIKGNGADPFRSLTVLNEGAGTALRVQGAGVGMEVAGMTGIRAEGDGNTGKGVVGTAPGVGGTGVEGQATFGHGVVGSGEIGVHGTGTTGAGVWGEGNTGVMGIGKGNNGRGVRGSGDGTGAIGVDGQADLGTGVKGTGTVGVQGVSGIGIGVSARGATGLDADGTNYGISAEGAEGVHATSSLKTGGVAIRGIGSGTGVRGEGMVGVSGDGETGVQGTGGRVGVLGRGTAPTSHGVTATGSGPRTDGAALYAENLNQTFGMAAYMVNSSSYHTVHLQNTYPGGGGPVLYLQNQGDVNGSGGGDFITAVGEAGSGDLQFRVTSGGHVWADEGFDHPAADYADMVPAEPGVAPGDVLVIGPDGTLLRSSAPYQTSVAGVHSTTPGIVGGVTAGGAPDGTVPLAIAGIVPVKVSAENGPIRPGDLLVTSGTPGHAMRAGADPPQGTVIGKALGRMDRGTGVIKILATLQ